jgi:type II secretory pathway component PulF
VLTRVVFFTAKELQRFWWVAPLLLATGQQQLKRFLTLLEPALILGLGALIAVVIVAILLAMLGLNDLLA